MNKPSFKKAPQSKITLGSLFFHWEPEKRRDFYFRMADEADIDCVYLGEVVCSKREIFFDPFLNEVTERLKAAGKQVILSTLALVTSEREKEAIEAVANSGCLIEANDVACVQLLSGKPHVIGPFINVFNEGAQDFVTANGAVRIVLPSEASASAIKVLAGKTKKAEIEVQVFGKQPLSVAMRCYHARSHGLNKDSCQFVCGMDADGLPASTLDSEEILTINGTQTLSRGYAVYLRELTDLKKMGVTHFRLSPQNIDMVRVAEIYRSILDQKADADEAMAQLKLLTTSVSFINGFLHGREGMSWVEESSSML